MLTIAWRAPITTMRSYLYSLKLQLSSFGVLSKIWNSHHDRKEWSVATTLFKLYTSLDIRLCPLRVLLDFMDCFLSIFLEFTMRWMHSGTKILGIWFAWPWCITSSCHLLVSLGTGSYSEYQVDFNSMMIGLIRRFGSMCRLTQALSSIWTTLMLISLMWFSWLSCLVHACLCCLSWAYSAFFLIMWLKACLWLMHTWNQWVTTRKFITKHSIFWILCQLFTASQQLGSTRISRYS